LKVYFFPILWVLVVGPALAAAFGGFAHGLDYFTYVSVGQIVFVIPFSAMFAGLVVITDRDFGILRELLVAPTGSRSRRSLRHAHSGDRRDPVRPLRGDLPARHAPRRGEAIRAAVAMDALRRRAAVCAHGWTQRRGRRAPCRGSQVPGRGCR
jgi:hypothetical protein